MLEVTGLSLAFGGVQAIDGLDFTVGDGVVTALIGANGAGKTSVLNVLSRFYQPQAGTAAYDGTDLLHLQPHDLIRHGVGRSFQNVALFKELPVLDNLLVGADHLGRAGLVRNTLRIGRARRDERQARERAQRVMEFLQITDLRDRRAGDLSFGDQKLVDMGRALTAGPSLLLLDEPASGMAEGQRAWLGEIIQRIPAEFGASVLLIDHDMPLVLGVSSFVIVMDFGRKIAEGDPEAVRHDEKVITAYLGEV
jgi:ABC-type branched-subunit amino acid transport system ATPase component